MKYKKYMDNDLIFRINTNVKLYKRAYFRALILAHKITLNDRMRRF